MATNELPDRAGVIAFPPFLYGSALLLSLLLRFLFPTPFLSQPAALVIGAVVLMPALVVLLSAFRQMIRNKTTINPGGSTTTIVSDGPYRYTRNPMYLALTLLYIGVCLMANAFWGLLLLIPVLGIVQKGIIEREERYLTRKFGADYLRYRNRVRRWL